MLAEGYKDTELGVIPVEWDVVELDSIVEFKNGKGHEQVIDENGQYIVVNSKFISTSGSIYKSSNSNLSPLKQNDITLVMSDIPNGKALAKCFYIKEDDRYTLNQRICSLTAIKDNPLYLFYRLNRNKYFLKFNDGVNQTNLRKNEVLECKIPLPPLKEQEKIADILSTADAKIDAIASQIEKAETLKKGLLQKLLSEGIGHSEFKDSELGKIPESWEVVTVEDISKVIRGASPRPKGDPRYYGGNIPRLMGTDVTRDGKYVIPNKDFLTAEGAKRSRFLPRGTLTIVCSGTVGVPSILGVDCCIHDGFLALIDMKKNIEVDFLFYLFSSLQQKFDNSATHGGVFTNLTTSIIKEFIIQLPPLEEQEQIAEILSTADEKLEVLRAKKEKYKTLKKGLLQKLLSGEVRV